MKRFIHLSVAAALLIFTVPAAVQAQDAYHGSRNSALNDTIRLLNGVPTFLGTIIATTTKNQADTASPFVIPAGQFLLVQCDAATYLLPGVSAATVTTANGVKVIADEKYYIMLKSGQYSLAALAVTGTVNCKVWRLD